MTEEVIIDGVNVKDCKRRIGKNSYCQYFKSSCADNNFNCIWKQNFRLKQENDELKAKLERIKILANGRLSLCEGCEENTKTGWCDEPCTAYYIKKELKMTNYEHIKAMNIDEMAEILVTCINPYEEVADFEYLSTVLPSIYYDKNLCLKDTKQWLESEVDDAG